LSVIDLSVNGRQPMSSDDGRYSVVYNGELYNYRELREELRQAGAGFKTESDTEVLLAAWAQWGTAALPRLKGMFAFAIVDLQLGTLTCARDAFGIKPLLLSYQPHHFQFASELSAVAALRRQGAQLDLQRAYDYLVHGAYDDGDATFVAGISHLLPGTFRVLDTKTGALSSPTTWWTPSVTQTAPMSFDEAAGHLRRLFIDSVQLHLRSDVPTGAALSGGIDSAAIVCAIRHIEPSAEIKTFSFVARGTPVSEENWIAQVNRHAGARSHTVQVDPEELVRDLDDLIAAQGEPFGSTSIYAQYRVYKLAREHGVTVTLDGQGADELLAGYHGFPGQRVRSLLDNGDWTAAARFLREWARWPGRTPARAIKSLVDEYAGNELHEIAHRVAGSRTAPGWVNAALLREQGVLLSHPRQPAKNAVIGRRMIAELACSATRRGLPSLLRHGDRNSMRFSVESRVPFLTTELADFVFSLPEHFLVSDTGETKSLLRAAMRGLVPDTVLDRRDKVGFATPELDWLSPLAAQARDWIGEADGIGFLRRDPMLREFDSMLAGRVRFSWQAWRWINFCRWHSRVLQPMNG
jgi:asparagine synthase (glutamine-hydrolysing)